MSEFRRKLRNEVIDPVQALYRVNTFNAKVTNSVNGKNATKCNIKYTDNEQKEKKVKNVPIRLYGNDYSGGWVPTEGDEVLVQQDTDGNLEIIARYSDNSIIEDYNLETDVYSDQAADTLPGVCYG